MSRRILIAGNESSLFKAVCEEAARRPDVYVRASIANDKIVNPQGEQQSSESDNFTLEWNASSPISARALVLSTINKIKIIDEAILICAPPAYRKTPEHIVPAELDQLIDNNVKSWFYLIRELMMQFKKQKLGTLSLIVSEAPAGSKEDLPDIVGSAAVSVFRNFAQGVLISSLNSPYNVMCFSNTDPAEEAAFASYIFKISEDTKKNSGKWFKYGKFNIFGR